MKKEFKITSIALRDATLADLELSNINKTQEPEKFSVQRMITPAVYRKKQTLNWLAAIHEEVRGADCQSKKEILCSETYRREVEEAGIKTYLINPVGRMFIKILVPRILTNHEKMQQHLDRLKVVSGVAASE